MQYGLILAFDREAVNGATFGALRFGIDGVVFAVNEVFVEGVFVERVVAFPAEDALSVGFVFGEEHLRRTITGEIELAQSGMSGNDCVCSHV